MKRLVYGVAVSALLLGTGGVGVACEQHDKSAALANPAAASQSVVPQGWVVAQQDGDKSTTDEEPKEKSEDSK